MAQTYSNTTDKSHGMRKPSYTKHKLKYAQDFDKGMNALEHTPYAKTQAVRENQMNRITLAQKKHYG